MIGQAIGPHRIIKLLETSPPSKLESDRPRMYQVMTAANKVGPIDMVQRLCIVMLPRVPSKFHQKLALHERVQLYKR